MIPAGIRIGEVEFFWDGPAGFYMIEGDKVPVEQMTPEIGDLVDQQINVRHQEALTEMRISSPELRRLKFLQCNCSSYDFTPDIEDGVMQLEYVACEYRGICKQEGKLCQPLMINGQKISMQELRITSLIRKGLYDKEISAVLNIAPQTLRTHKQNIERKLNADRKVQVALKAVEYGII